MGGELSVTSELGVGSEFSFELPFELSDPDQGAVPEMTHQHVLVVDDHELALHTMTETARSLGWDAHAVSSGETAVNIMTGPQGRCYDVVLLDWHMPGLDGLRAAAQIKARAQALSSAIIIMVSSSDRSAILQQPENTAVDGVLTKPITSSSLYDAVLSAKQSRSQLQST
jgi:CheY-like chemotaxis protein